MRKVGKASLEFERVYLVSAAAVSGPMEAEGPIGEFLDASYPDLHCNTENWEQAEIQLMSDAIQLALLKKKMKMDDIDVAFAGDLNNQIAISNYVMRDFALPFVGIFGACSTCCLGLITGSTFLDGGYGENVLCTTSSHNATAERQYRYPTEYGGQKPNTLTFTVTGAGAGIISRKKSSIKVTKATIGVVQDSTLTDPLDMGRAMAPAAAKTLKQHLEDFGAKVTDYDLILTGDLSKFGSQVMKDICNELHIPLGENYVDCGLMVYNIDKQPVFAGGSGCASAALVTYAYVYNQMLRKELSKVLIIATGALMNPVMIAQNETIPVIAHAVVLERVD